MKLRSPSIITVLFILIMAGRHSGLHGQTWDAASNFSPTDNPNGPWSYHNGFTKSNAPDGIEPNALLFPNPGMGCGGSPGGWSLTSDGCPNVFADRWSTNGVQIVGCELGGHGPWMVRWTSPVSGVVIARYTLLQLFEPDRRMTAEIRHNGILIDRLLMPQHANGKTKLTHERANNPESPGTRTNMTTGEMSITVREGDTISYHTLGGTSEIGGNCADTFVYASFTIGLDDSAIPCQEICDNAIDDDNDGNVDCMDEECGCSTLDNDSFDVVFPNVFKLPANQNSKLRITPIGVTSPGHITASDWRPDECPIFFAPPGEIGECPASSLPAPLDFTSTCWAVDSSATFDSATVTIEAHLSKLKVSAEEANTTLIVSMDHEGNLTPLPVAFRSVESAGSIWIVVVSSTPPRLDNLTFALVGPSALLESDCTDGVDNDEDGNTDCDDANCAPTPDCVCPLIPQTYYQLEDDLVDAVSGHSHGTTDAIFSDDVPDVWISGKPNTRSLRFSGGTTAHFDGSPFIFHNSCDATLEFFIKPADQQHVAVFWTQDGGGDENRYNLHFQSQGLGADYREAGGALHNVLNGDIPLPLNTWSHVGCVRTRLDGGGHRYEWYVNHELRDTAIDSRPLPPTVSTWTISGRGGCCNEFTGLIDEIRMTPEALTPDQFLVPGVSGNGVGPFIRGDCDGNGRVGGSPTEAIVLLLWAFRGAAPPPCIAACDMNADGSASGNPTDAVLILTFSFQGGASPPPPFPDCDQSALETDVALGCNRPFCDSQ